MAQPSEERENMIRVAPVTSVQTEIEVVGEGAVGVGVGHHPLLSSSKVLTVLTCAGV